jgi:glycerophosphoryl diester phosphodiesterase
MRGRPRLTVVFGFVAVVVVAWLVALAVARVRLDAQPPAAFFDQPAVGDNGDLLVFAHQGGELLWPSNTMVAFAGAADLGADVLDADMLRTADGELVLIHDTTVDRTSEGTGLVEALTLAELRALDFGYRFQALPAGESTAAAAAEVDDAADPFPFRGQGHGIVTVEEWFDEFASARPSLRFGIEIKQAPPEAADELCAAIQAFALEDRVLVSSFAQPNMDRFRAACPSVATSATEPEFRRFYLAHRLGLNGLVRPGYQALQIPQTASGFTLLTPGLLADADAWGLAVVPWTINDPDDLHRITALGVEGINTDRPDLLVAQLAEG